MLCRRAFTFLTLAMAVVSSAGAVTSCGPVVELENVIEIIDVHSGYTDLGIVNGKTKLVPTATIHLKNIGAQPLDGLQLSAAFWRTGEDGQKDELQLPHLVAKALAAGAPSEAILLRANSGYTLEGARADFFQHSQFLDYTIKIFGKTGGRIAKLGEVKVERKILPKDGAVPTK